MLGGGVPSAAAVQRTPVPTGPGEGTTGGGPASQGEERSNGQWKLSRQKEADHKNDASFLEIKKEGIYSVMWKFPILAGFPFPHPILPFSSPHSSGKAQVLCVCAFCIEAGEGGIGNKQLEETGTSCGK